MEPLSKEIPLEIEKAYAHYYMAAIVIPNDKTSPEYEVKNNVGINRFLAYVKTCAKYQLDPIQTAKTLEKLNNEIHIKKDESA